MKLLLPLLTIALLATLAPVAHAELMRISYQIDGLPQVQCDVVPLPGPINCPNTLLPLDISQLGADSNSPGTSTFANLTSSTVDLSNPTSSSLDFTIVIYAQGFTMPTGPAFLFSNVAGTVLPPSTASTLTFISCIDPFNRAIDTSVTGGTCPAGSIASSPSTPNIASLGAFSQPQLQAVIVPATTFALDQTFKFTLAAGAHLNWSASTAVLSEVPEPTTTILVLGGTGLLGLSTLLKRLFQRRVV
jgi:hypothetical protein